MLVKTGGSSAMADDSICNLHELSRRRASTDSRNTAQIVPVEVFNFSILLHLIKPHSRAAHRFATLY